MNNSFELINGRAPNTDPDAKPIEWVKATAGRRVIWVKNASYRNAIVSGEFMVAEGDDVENIVHGTTLTIDVECYWYDWRPETRWIRLSLTGDCEELQNYTGTVIHRLGQLEKFELRYPDE